ncbi:class I tRNA ligase family protein, partial [Candidatus Dojkabacteria bacterium]|nr:class I tRNA ligase family protein [Candidatus Dojkabacteria bacterium]
KNKETGEVISEPDAEEKAETQKVLLYALVSYLKMLHPFIPFITEQIWQLLPAYAEASAGKPGGPETAKSLMYTRWK